MTSVKSFHFALLFPAALALLACKNEVTDTEGRTFTFDCKNGNCHLSPLEENAAKSSAAYIAQNEGRVLLVCPVENPGFDCRPIACDETTPCSGVGGPSFTCEKRVCQAPDRSLTPADKLALCLAETGDWKKTPLQLERLTMARACTDECVIPAICRGI